MGKPFDQELKSIGRTFESTRRMKSSAWRNALDLDGLSLIVLGSGGSLSLARFAARLNEDRGGAVSRAETPLGVTRLPANLRKTAVMLISARGRNADILSAYRALVRREPQKILVVCSRIGSPLSKLARSYDEGSVLEFDSPAGNDGFLATNSLVATAIMLVRGFLGDESEESDLPMTLDEFFPELHVTVPRTLSKPGFLERETLVVLHGKDTAVAAGDLESKLTEAALARPQISDFRNFAHGRHHWLAKRGIESAVLTIETKADEMVAKRTMELLPHTIPAVRLKVPHDGYMAELAGLLAVLHVTGCYGGARSIDPGRPGVPAFGRRLYNLRDRAIASPSSKDIRVSRKLSSTTFLGSATARLRTLLEAEYERAILKLRNVQFGALVLDYDGTLCHYTRRFTLPDEILISKLARLARGGLILGFATGRGKSARHALQKVVPARLWDKIAVGYYNCTNIGLLADDELPDTKTTASDDLRMVAEALSQDKIVSRMCEVTVRPLQITVAPRLRGISEKTIWPLVAESVVRAKVGGVQILSSTHSVDVIGCGRSKLDLLAYLREKFDLHGDVLCIGDRGAWPGNDYELLSYRFSLSVDEVSASPDGVWNLAPAGRRGTAALDWYLDRLKMRGSTAVFRDSEGGGKRH